MQSDNGFGDDGFGAFGDDQQEMPSFYDFELNVSRSNESMSIVSRHPSINFDEKMIDIVEAGIDQESNAIEQIPVAPIKEPIVRRKENPLNLLAKVTPLPPPDVDAVRGGHGKRRCSVFKDDDKIISKDMMKKRIDK